MPNRIQNSFLLIAILLLAIWPSAGRAADHGETRILVLPLERAVRSDDLVLRVQVVGETALQNVTLWATRDGDSLFRALPMERAGEGRYEATLPYDPVGGSWQSYYVEGASGSGRLFSNGSAESPFLVEPDPSGSSGASDSGASVWVAGLLLIPPLLLLFVLVVQPRRKLREREFWLRVVAPVSGLEGKEFQDALVELSLRRHFHPERGTMLFTADQIRSQVARLRQTHPEELERARRTYQQSLGEAREVSQKREERYEPRSPDEEIFWFHLLGSLVDQSGESLKRSLIALAGKVHAHPIQGRRVFDVPRLRGELQRVQQIDPSELVARAKSVPASAADSLEQEIDAGVEAALSRSSGFSAVELLVAVALMALLVTMGALSVTSMATPLESAGETLMAMIEQTRSKAIYTTRIHRLRPLSSHHLIVEYASSCGSSSWTYDPAISLELPRQVTLTETDWSVCFDRRGLSSANLVIVLHHPDRGERELELFKGGVMRWRS